MISGAVFPLVEEQNSSLSKNKIYVGYNSKFSDKKFKKTDESFKYFNNKNNIAIWGGKNRGTMYGVFSFLENELGVRWLTSKVEIIPKRSTRYFSDFYDEESPAFKYRIVDYYDMQEGTISAPQKNNSLRVQQNPPQIVDEINGRGEQPGSYEKFWFHHSFDTFVPVEEYFDKVQDLVTSNSYISIWTKPSDEIFTDEFINESTELFRKAENAAETDALFHRVEVTELGILYLKLSRNPKEAIKNGILDRIEEITKREKINYTSEGTKREEMIKHFRNKI